MSEIELGAVIRDLRAELQAAVTAADGEPLRFELGPIELEVAIAVERSATAGAKLRFWVLDASKDGKAGFTGTQRVKLTLTPAMAADGARPQVSGPGMLDEQ